MVVDKNNEMEFVEKPEMEGDYLLLIRLMGSDIFYQKSVKIFIKILLMMETFVILCYIYQFAYKFTLNFFLQHIPMASVTIFGMTCLIHLVLDSSFVSQKRNEYKLWSEKTGSAKIKNEIKREAFWVNVYGFLNCVLGVLAATLHCMAYEGDEDFFLIVALLNRSGWHFGGTIATIYRWTVLALSYCMIATTYQIMYNSFHFKIQICLLQEQLKNLTKNFGNNNDSNLLIYDGNYQLEVEKRLIFCIKRYEEISRVALQKSNQIRVHIVPYSLAGCLIGVSSSFYVYMGITYGDFWRPVILFTAFSSTFWGLIWAGQLLETEFEKLSGSILETLWYTWDYKNSKLLLMFLLRMMKPFTLKFTTNIAINYNLGISIIKGIFSLLSVLLQLRTMNPQ